MARVPTKDDIAFLDTADFLAVMRQYADESGKDYATAINLKMRDAALKAASAATVAKRSDIVKSFTPRIVAGRLKKKPIKSYQVSYLKRMKDGTRKVAYRWVKRHYSRQDAYQYYMAVTGRRIRSINFLKSFFIALARAIEKASPDVPTTSNQKHKPGHRVNYLPATAEKPEGSGFVEYTYLKAKRAGLDPILQMWWNVGLGMTILDAQQYIARKMRERASGHSVK